MRSLVLIAAGMAMLSGIILSIAPCRAYAQLSPELRQIATELDALAAEIQLIDDLNTLQLQPDQIERLIPAVDELRATAIGFEQQRVALLRQLRPLLERKRDLLLADEPPSTELREQISAMEAQLNELDRQADEAFLAHAVTFREILTDPQVAIITGEEDARRQVVELLEWIREMDDETFEREAPPYAGELADPELGLGEEEILDLFTLARAMDAEQYSRSSSELIGRLIELFRPRHDTADRIIVTLFLHPAMPKVLQEKLKVLSNGR